MSRYLNFGTYVECIFSTTESISCYTNDVGSLKSRTLKHEHRELYIMRITHLLATCVFALASTAANAVVWIPDTNSDDGTYQDITFISDGISSVTYDLVFYDAGATPVIGNADTITIDDFTAVIVDISDPAPHTATAGTESALLGDTAEFELALYDGATFIEVTSWTAILPGNTYDIQFGELSGELKGVDLAPIPVPAAVWLFGSGLLGLVGIARRRA